MPLALIDRPLRPRTLSLVMALSTVVSLGACSGKPNQQMPQTEVGVVTLKAERLPVHTELPGRTVAYMTSDVRPQVGGILRKRLFTEGADVKAGQVLYEIDPATYQASYDNAAGTLAQAEAEVLSARPKAERYRSLLAADAVSKQDADDAIASLKEAEASVVASKASLQSARIDLDYTRITAPISGRIGTSAYTPGALVTADQSTALATINQLDPIYVDVVQSSAQLLRLREQIEAGMLKAVDGKAEVSVVLEDGSTYAQTGTLEVVTASVDETTGTVKLRAVLPNAKHQLLPGMYVKAVLSTAVNEQALLVPQQSVTRDAKGDATVWVVGNDGKVAQRSVKLGDAVGDRWVATSGLKAGEKVVVEGTQKVSAGASVKAVEVDASKKDDASKPSGGQDGKSAMAL